MEDLAQLQSRLAGIGELLEVVGAMRSMAAARTQQAQQALEGIRRYEEVVGEAIRSVLPLIAEAVSPPALRLTQPGWLVVFCSQHGFAGPFNELLLDAAGPIVAETSARLCVVGARGALRAQERRWSVPWSQSMATQVGGVPETARLLEAELVRRLGAGEPGRVELLFASAKAGGALELRRLPLLPLRLELFSNGPRPPPLHNLPAPLLAEKLVGEYVFAELVRAAMESLLSENTSRLRAMEVARQNIAGKADELRLLEHQVRQEQTTSELLDVVTGAEALVRDRTRGPG